MFSIFVTILLGSVGPAEESKPLDLREHWSIDRETVTSGGCVIIILDDVGSALRGLTIQIDDRDPVKLLERAGPTIQRHVAPGPVTTTFVLISHDFHGAEGVELVSREPEIYRMVPIFNEPGSVRLTLQTPDRSLGTKVVTVVPPSPDAKAAVNLLFPEYTREQGPRTTGGRIIVLLGSADHGPSASRNGPDLPEFKKELEILRKHPDWAEVFEMLVTQLEARVELSELRQAIKSGEIEVDSAPNPAPLPQAVTQALQREVKSPFAKAIQDGIRATIGQRALLWRNAHRVPPDDE